MNAPKPDCPLCKGTGFYPVTIHDNQEETHEEEYHCLCKQGFSLIKDLPKSY